jgi:uncharacterized protein GlcG (DUF336 family)
MLLKFRASAALAFTLTAGICLAHADTCAQLMSPKGRGLTHATLKAALQQVVPANSPSTTPNGGLGFPMWLTLIDGSGRVCAVVTSLDGTKNNADVTTDIWLGSRVISAQKANTANSFSTGLLSLSTANLYAAVQPGGSLFGLQESNPVDAMQAYQGNAANFGTPDDPLVGVRVGGVNVFGGGLTLYFEGKKVGAIGVSGDTSCTDHVVAWKVRNLIHGGAVPANGPFDKMIQDIVYDPNTGLITKASASGFGHPFCLNNPTAANDGGSIVH